MKTVQASRARGAPGSQGTVGQKGTALPPFPRRAASIRHSVKNPHHFQVAGRKPLRAGRGHSDVRAAEAGRDLESKGSESLR